MNTDAMEQVARAMEGVPALDENILVRLNVASFGPDTQFPRQLPRHDGPAVIMSKFVVRGSARKNPSHLKGECGTVGCMAGHTVCTLDPENRHPSKHLPVFYRAMILLGLDTLQAEWLFLRYPVSHTYEVDGDTCARALRLLASGVEAWRVWGEVVPDSPQAVPR